MPVQVIVELPEEAFSSLRSTPNDFVKEMRIAAAVKWYEMGTLSQSKAAEMSGVSRQEFIEALSRYQVSPFQVTSEELTEELTRE